MTSLASTRGARIAIVDTTFATIDMGAIVADQLGDQDVETTRVTVPGFKDLAAASRRAIDNGVDLVIACAMPGPEPIDESCAKDASFGLQMVQALTGTPVLEVFVHMSEAIAGTGEIDDAALQSICDNRCRGHADNAVRMLLSPDQMIERAGTGRRQGAADAGALALN